MKAVFTFNSLALSCDLKGNLVFVSCIVREGEQICCVFIFSSYDELHFAGIVKLRNNNGALKKHYTG